MVIGENAQVTPAGGFVQLNAMALLNPPVALALTERVVDCPCVTVALCAENDSAKSDPLAADAGTNVANKPLVCVAPPAVK
jgi:hypothetical protein